ncbi:hypothetical protein [Palleronia sp. LCG004]|uniref:hypothetical protein n=1 Tax=Palleronia sp. LCG004 TaxID=3079304 RepID=UPI002942C92F|nr:hypothetical protein [Palleronia sp. LCG004]WOI57760.1 hypothetical protein RVY76_16060 [Palleronia sp. LCG004]
MTMFSMKPKFDLAEFLAVPAPVGGSRGRYAGRRGSKFQKPEPSDDTANAKSTENSSSGETVEKLDEA